MPVHVAERRYLYDHCLMTLSEAVGLTSAFTSSLCELLFSIKKKAKANEEVKLCAAGSKKLLSNSSRTLKPRRL